MTIKRFGLLFPQNKKHAEKYPLKLGIPVASSKEKILKYPRKLIEHYDQRGTNACTGYATSWAMTICNTVNLSMPRAYLSQWLYTESRKIDFFPNPEEDRGSTLVATFDVLRSQGHLLSAQQSPSLGEGVLRNEWALTVDDIRLAISFGIPVVFGMMWFESFDVPFVDDKGDRWITPLGNILGGHAICGIGMSDSRQAFLLLNSWGKWYPPVWLHYTSVEKMLNDWTLECCVPVDRPNKNKINWE